MKSRLIPCDGPAVDIEPANGKKFTLAELQKFVGGYIELAGKLKDGRVMIVNEEGKLHGLPLNEQATMLYQTCFPTADSIVGNAVLIAPRKM